MRASNTSGELESEEDCCRRFSLAEILLATKGFDEKTFLLGKGGYAKVYRGIIDNGATTVAVKRLNNNSGQEVFKNEIKLFSKLRHTHLLPLIGYCDESGEMILVYEYMPRGDLAHLLYKKHKKASGGSNGNISSSSSVPHLTWQQRLNISVGVASGLQYLHTGTHQSIIHRDVKPANILLDKNWVAKISDFGSSKVLASPSDTHVTTKVLHTTGYCDPAYFNTSQLTQKSDVYSFGVVLLELLCGRPAVDETLGEEQIGLVSWAKKCTIKGKIDQIIDPSLSGQISQDCLTKFLKVVKNCLKDSREERPTMAEVKECLELALESQREGSTKVLKDKSCVPKFRHWQRQKQRQGKVDDSESGPSSWLITEIQAATKDFDNSLLICPCSSDNVYAGCKGGRTPSVAIKRLKALTTQQRDKIMGKIEGVRFLSRHPHTVSLIGFCCNNDELILVYDYMANGSLKDHLHRMDNNPLLWKKRLEICIDTAQGLQYLHNELRIKKHGIESSKILLDEELAAKVPVIIPIELPPPRYDKFNSLEQDISGHRKLIEVEPNPDVYLFGVVLLEVLLAPCDQVQDKKEPPLVCVFLESINKGVVHGIIDPNLRGKIAPKCLNEFVMTALRCLRDERINMGDVLQSLQTALQLQEAWENRIEIGIEEPVMDPNSSNTAMCKTVSNAYYKLSFVQT